MTGETTLRGITWDHPRGLDPLLAASEAYRGIAPGVRIEWHTRSLSGFGEDPLIDLAASFDLLIIDHPFVGDAASSTAFHPLDTLAPDGVIDERRHASVGPSHESYWYAGHQWALAIDAAAQVSAIHERFRDRQMPATWDAALDLGAELRRAGGWMAVPMWPADLMVATYSIARGMGVELFVDGRVFPGNSGIDVLNLLQRLCDLSHPDAVKWNPPSVLDRMRDGEVDYCPILFGYSNYSRSSAPGDRVFFGDIPTATGSATGSTLGGAGIAISTACADPAAAMAFATWVTSAAVQTGLYFESGGQPARLESWVDDEVNGRSGDFFRRTQATMVGAYVRPRLSGYQAFQKAGSELVAACMTGRMTVIATLAGLDDLWRSTQRDGSDGSRTGH
jgi:multiple sugar transport system substrate-binding protein